MSFWSRAKDMSDVLNELKQRYALLITFLVLMFVLVGLLYAIDWISWTKSNANGLKALLNMAALILLALATAMKWHAYGKCQSILASFLEQELRHWTAKTALTWQCQIITGRADNEVKLQCVNDSPVDFSLYAVQILQFNNDNICKEFRLLESGALVLDAGTVKEVALGIIKPESAAAMEHYGYPLKTTARILIQRENEKPDTISVPVFTSTKTIETLLAS